MAAQVYTGLFFGPFRMITKAKELKYELSKEKPTVNDLVERIVVDFPELKEYFYDNSGSTENSTAIIINGEDIRGSNGFDTIILPTDRITFFKAAGGG